MARPFCDVTAQSNDPNDAAWISEQLGMKPGTLNSWEWGRLTIPPLYRRAESLTLWHFRPGLICSVRPRRFAQTRKAANDPSRLAEDPKSRSRLEALVGPDLARALGEEPHLMPRRVPLAKSWMVQMPASNARMARPLHRLHVSDVSVRFGRRARQRAHWTAPRQQTPL